jgi:hypothetical protein
MQCFKLDKTAAEMHEMSETAYGSDALTKKSFQEVSDIPTCKELFILNLFSIVK